MSGPLSRKAIVQAVQALKRALTAWENQPIHQAPTTLWRGVRRKQISGEVESAAQDLFDLVNRLDIEESAYPLVLEIDRFDDIWLAWAETCSKSPDQADPSGSPEVWAAWEQVLKELTPRSYSLPEPIGALANAKPPVSPNQIAKIYGWYDEHGQPDTQKVQEEITTPGTHFNPKTWVHPSRKRFEAQMQRTWQERAKRVGDARRSGPAESRPEQRAKPEAPESVEELIRQGVNSAQIVKMKKTTMAHVRAVAAELGVPLDGNVVADVFRKGRADTDDEKDIAEKAETMRVAGLNTHDELGGDIKGRVLAMSADGVKPGDITKALTLADPNLNHQKVVKILKDAKLETAK
jgi:hypothetical protein